MRQANVEFGVASVGALLSMIGVVHAMSFPRGSAYLPTAVLSLLSILLVAWSVKALILTLKSRTEHFNIKKAEAKRFGILIISSIALIAIAPWIGFTTAFLIFVPLTGFLLGYRKWKGLISAGIIFASLVFLVFLVLLSRPLPSELYMRFL